MSSAIRNAPGPHAERFDYRGLVEAVHHSFGEQLLGGSTFHGLIGRALRLSREARLVRPYAQSPAVYSCVRVNADALASVPRRVWLTHDEEAAEAEADDPLVRLFEEPNPLMGGRKFQRAISIALDMSGGVFLFLTDKRRNPISPGEMPAEMWPVRDDLVEPVMGADGTPEAWEIERPNKKRDKFPAHAVAHIYWPDPHDMFRGFGPLQAAWRSADHLFRAEAFDDGLVENGGQIGGYFTREDGRALTPEQKDSLDKMIEQNASRPQHDKKKIVLPPGWKFVATAFSPADMQASELRKDKRAEIGRIFGVPPVMLGELEDANRSSLREQRRVYYENTIGPRCEFLDEEIARHLIPLLPEEFGERWVQHDYAATPAMREDLDAQLQRMERLVAMGVPVGQAAMIAGIDADDLGEDRFLGTSLRPMAEAMAPKPEAPEDEPEEEPEDEMAVRQHAASDRRRAAAAAEERRLASADRRAKKAMRGVFERYVDEQLKRLREVAASGAGRNSAPRPWSWYTESARWSAAAHAYAPLVGYAPVTGSAGWFEVCAITEDELDQLILGNERRWGEELWGVLNGPLKGAVEDAARAAQKLVGGELISAADPAVIEYLRAKEILVVEGPMSVVAEQVKRALVAGLADAQPAGTLADRVRGALEELEDELMALRDRLGTRAAMIARTEVASASSAARAAQFKAAGIVQNEWVSAGDDLVRPGHDIDGELAVVGEPFSNGLRYPGDPRGSAEMVINCRCVLVPVVPDE